MHYSLSCLVASKVAELGAVRRPTARLDDQPVAADRMSHISSVNGGASALVGRKHVAGMPDAGNDVILHLVIFARAKSDSAVTAEPRIVWPGPALFGCYSYPVDDVLFDYEVLGSTTSDTKLDEFVNNVAFEGYFI